MHFPFFLIFFFFPPDLEFSESEENNDYETLHLGKGVDFLANVTKQNFTDTPAGKNIYYLQSFFFPSNITKCTRNADELAGVFVCLIE